MTSTSQLSPAELATRGLEKTGREMFQTFPEHIKESRVEELMAAMHAASPSGGTDMAYGSSEAQRLRLGTPPGAVSAGPIIIFIHGGSWKAGSYLDSVGSRKISHLVKQGYAFASEVANAVGFLAKNADTYGLDPERTLLMGHSSGAHVAALLGTDTGYLARAGVGIRCVRGVVALDGSNFNAATEMIDSPGPVAHGTAFGLGEDMSRLQAVSPSYHARAPNARSFLLFQVQRLGDIRQAVELSLALSAAGTECALAACIRGPWV
ncbi:hypothetical protein diail_7115 [Diaporthe ilicicola]|nr:hypothetical protein diail_7115 [Diaporthe ilicicola]